MKFDRNKYAAGADKVSLTELQKLALTEHMRRANTAKQPKRNFRSRGFTALTRSLAAAIAVIMLGVGIFTYYVFNPHHENSFVLTASAAKFKIDGSKIKIASCETGGTPIYYKDVEKRNWVYNYVISDLQIEGKNIDTVSFSIYDKGVFFYTFPYSKYLDNVDGSNQSQYISALNKTYIEREPLTNSFYKNLTKVYDVSSDINFCDGFTIKNTDENDCIKLDDQVWIYFEPDKSDKETCALLKGLYNHYDKMEGLEHQSKEKWIANGCPDEAIDTTPEMREVEQDLDEADNRLMKKVTEGKKMHITVKYKDGTKENVTMRFSGSQETKDGVITSFLSGELER